VIPGGYILQPRCFGKSEAAHFPPATREIWFYLLREVNHSDNGIHKRGQRFFQFSDIQEGLSWFVGYRKETYSKPQITKALRRLSEGNMIATAKATRGVVITICNYNTYQTPSNYEGNSEGNTKETRRNLGGRTINKNDEERKNEEDLKTSGEYTDQFLEFWKSYPKKKSKGAAYKAWKKIKNKDSTLKEILNALEWQIKTEDWTKDKGQFIPNPSTYLNAAGWEDERPGIIEEEPLIMSLEEMEEKYGNPGMDQSNNMGRNPAIEITQFEECTEGHSGREEESGGERESPLLGYK
jgi:hypothetical protein